MSGWTLGFVLLLPLTVCLGSEVTLVKTIQDKTDVTRVCSNETVNIITLIICKIGKESIRREECRLSYRYVQGFEHGCDPRFKLRTENQTVFLHLTSLRPEDNGNYTCECSQPGGTSTLHINITVEENVEESLNAAIGSTLLPVLIGVTVVIIITTVILTCFHKRASHRHTVQREKTQTQDIEPYSTFTERESGLYSTVKLQPSYNNIQN
ncbi:hypothetical protein Q5P01_000282 [Channa striata]|uniref:Immunoglobulin V-set domain-containing protein n=1 Tax=Channa striata TaxID=64152 RepID=A0AA88IGI3_CHASR|nr:hypothetical protein Q5P01_000282 [Channa striata]